MSFPPPSRMIPALLAGLLLFFLPVPAPAAAPADEDVEYEDIPRSLDSYGDTQMSSVGEILLNRIEEEPFNLVATVIFVLAVLHTFLAGRFRRYAHKLEEAHHQRLLASGASRQIGEPEEVCFKAKLFDFLGEVETIFGIWLIPLVIAIISFYGWNSLTHYIDYKVHYTEPIFVVVVMIIAATRPVMVFAKACMKRLAGLGGHSPAAWWISILIAGPLLGSFITEPAAITISALLLSRYIFGLNPSVRLKYATLGLLFVNISVGGTLTHFAAPPVLMVAKPWNWDMLFMLTNFGWKAATGIALATLGFYACFRSEFLRLRERHMHCDRLASGHPKKERPVPPIVIGVHLFFLAWTVINLHHPPLFIAGFLFFLAFTQATAHHQEPFSLKGPILVGFFLAGLVTHGVLQQWWIAPVLSALSEFPLFVGATILTAFNDNAAITFLASQVPAFDPELALNKELALRLEYAVVAGAVTGGGLTVIANAPNPAGQAILSRHFENGISPLGLLLGALVPTGIMALCFLLL